MFPSVAWGLGDVLRQRIRQRPASFTASSLSNGSNRSGNGLASGSMVRSLSERGNSEIDSAAVPVSGNIPQDVLLARAEMEGFFRKARLHLTNQYIYRKIHTRLNLADCALSYSKTLDPEFCRHLLRALKAAAVSIDLSFKKTFKGICMRSRHAEAMFRQAQTADDIEQIVCNFEKHVRRYELERRILISTCLERLFARLRLVQLQIHDQQWAKLVRTLYFVTEDGFYEPAHPVERRRVNSTRRSADPAGSAPRLSLNFETSAQASSRGFGSIVAEIDAVADRAAATPAQLGMRSMLAPLSISNVTGYCRAPYADSGRQDVANRRVQPTFLGHIGSVVQDNQRRHLESCLPIRSRPQPRNNSNEGDIE